MVTEDEIGELGKKCEGALCTCSVTQSPLPGALLQPLSGLLRPFLLLCLQSLWDLAVRMLLLRRKSDLVIHLNALMSPQHTVDETETL